MNRRTKTVKHSLAVIITSLLPCISSAPLHADASSTNSFYLPYVQQLEKEIEYQLFYLPADNRRQLHQLAYGQSLSDNLAIEIGVAVDKEKGQRAGYEAFELELLWQLTEQGEFAWDWALLLEAEHEKEDKANELALALITAREWGRWTTASNLYLIYENSDSRRSELETALALQAGYRLSPHIEPALEFFAGQGVRTLGPVLGGLVRLSGARKLRWQTALLFGLDDDSSPTTWRLQLEYEFF
ncbi:MAG TPA: hypothetical protein VIN71_13405 [Pseudomonadales bacterium]